MNISIKNLNYRITVTVAVAIAFFVVIGSQNVNAQTKPTRPGNGQSEGIKVHGHWVIEVRNPDGKIVTRREYENALHAEGKAVLASLLGRQATTGLWRIHLNIDPVASPQISMYIVEQNDSQNFPSTPLKVSNSLVVATNADKFILTGSVTPDTQALIGYVGTMVSTCGSNVTPQSCASNTFVRFTDKFLPTNIDVAPGQIVQVKVTISFS